MLDVSTMSWEEMLQSIIKRSRMLSHIRAAAAGLQDLVNNRALDVPRYEPGYTLAE